MNDVEERIRSAFEPYRSRTDLDGRKEAIQKIADEILSRSVEGW